MLVIVFMENLFISDIKKVAILNNNIEKFDRYVLREGKYSFSLPEGWDIDSRSNNNDVIVTFNNKEDIYGSISILNNSVDNMKIYKDGKKIIENGYTWTVISKSDKKHVSKYYMRDYSEGRVLAIEFSYTEGKVKNSIKVVFDYIVNSFI